MGGATNARTRSSEASGAAHAGADLLLGRFLMEDTIIAPQGVMSLDGYSYAKNAPVLFVDPDGHRPACEETDDPACDEPNKNHVDPYTVDDWAELYSLDFGDDWTEDEKWAAVQGAREEGIKILDQWHKAKSKTKFTLRDIYMMDQTIRWTTPWDAFKYIHPHTTLVKATTTVDICDDTGCGNTHPQYCEGGAVNTITCYNGQEITSELIVHELGHNAAWNFGQGATYKRLEGEAIYVNGTWLMGSRGGAYERTTWGYRDTVPPYMQHGTDWDDFVTNSHEDWADMFMNWVFGAFADDVYGKTRDDWMTILFLDLIIYR